MEQVEDDVKLRREAGGRAVVSRAWITRYTGAGRSTVARWYALRHEQPAKRRVETVKIPHHLHVCGSTMKSLWSS
ncbi:hypothetical protein [Streptomyces clavifer]|uniref:hypothetical protein n=1 Tax=Streptomyces clavifer TaxID=68188 RepID=UPI0037F3240E